MCTRNYVVPVPVRVPGTRYLVADYKKLVVLVGDYKYLYNNNCWDNCEAANVPSDIVAYNPGNYGRECRAPFTCTNRADPDGVRCKCHRSVGGNNCASCDIDALGLTCTLCTGNKYLHQGRCRNSCPVGTIPTGVGRTGRECQ